MDRLRADTESAIAGSTPAAAAAQASRRQSSRPLLMLDIDGVISLFGFPAADPPPGRFHAIEGVPHFISAAAAPLIARLANAFELVWASGWEDRANDHLPHLLGLPGPLPVLSFERSATARAGAGVRANSGPTATATPTMAAAPPRMMAPAAKGSMRAHWKLDAIDAHAGQRPLAWVDDAFDRSCEQWAASRPAPTILIATEPAVGLTEAHAKRLLSWATDHVAAPL